MQCCARPGTCPAYGTSVCAYRVRPTVLVVNTLDPNDPYAERWERDYIRDREEEWEGTTR